MSENIKMDALFPGGAAIQAKNPLSHTKASGVKTPDTEGNSGQSVGWGRQGAGNATAAILNISKEARLKLKQRTEHDRPEKKAGVTSAREQFENEALERRTYLCEVTYNPGVGCHYPEKEWMRLDEPETYAKYSSLELKHLHAERGSEDHIKYGLAASKIEWDWFNRKCRDKDGWLKNPVTGKRAVISVLEDYYSDDVHDTSFDVYDDSFSDEDASLWRFGTKFNVMLPAELLNEMELLNHFNDLTEEEQGNLSEKMEKIDAAVNNMKEAEKNYEGDLRWLRFGVKFDKDCNATYYANYTGCEDKNGIMADSPEELLDKLMADRGF